MERAPPRRSARLMNNTSINSNALLSPILEASFNTAVSNSSYVLTSVSSTAATTDQMPIDDGALAAPAVHTVAGTDSVPVSRQIPENSSASHNFDDIERRIAMLELHLRDTQVQLREREAQNEVLRAALLSNGSSAVTYASSVVAQSQPAPPRSTQTQFEAPLTNALPTNVQSGTSTPFIEAPFMPPPTSVNSYSFIPRPVICSAMSGNLRNASELPTNDVFSSQSSSAPIPTTQANGAHANLQYSPNNFNFPKKLLDLPDFSGRPEDWPVFYAVFMESTAAYGYSNFDNNQRLQRCLKGDARETVKSLLIHRNNVGCIIEQLKFRFGRPEQLVRSQLAQVKEIAPISENFLCKLISFATKVKNVCAFLQSSGAEDHISNPMLLDEIIAKLLMSKRIEWGRYATALQMRATALHFSDWLTSLANVICTVNDECQHPARELKRRMVLHLDETMSRKCPFCQGQHKPADCKHLIEATVSDRWTEVKSRRLCFACLNAGHTTSSCRRRKLCGIDGCNRAHHRLLHEFRSERPSAPPTSSSRSVARSASSRSTSPPNNPHQQPSRDKGATVLSCATNSPERKLLYRILPVTLYGKQRRVDTYALLDEGSSITMLDSSLAKELDLQGRPHSPHVQWFGGHAVQEPATLVDLHISGAGMKKRHSLQRVHAVRNLQLPTQSFSRSDLILDDKEARHLPMQHHSSSA